MTTLKGWQDSAADMGEILHMTTVAVSSPVKLYEWQKESKGPLDFTQRHESTEHILNPKWSFLVIGLDTMFGRHQTLHITPNALITQWNGLTTTRWILRSGRVKGRSIIQTLWLDFKSGVNTITSTVCLILCVRRNAQFAQNSYWCGK